MKRAVRDMFTDQDGPKTETLIFAGLVVVAIALLFYLSGQRQQVLRASPVGFDGLQVWLAKSELPAQNFTGGWTLTQDSVDLLVLPLFDTDPTRSRTRPQTKEDLLFQQDETDQRIDVIKAKVQQVPSLLVLPKWRSGLRLSGLGHPALLVETQSMDAMLEELLGRPMGIDRILQPFTEFDYASDAQQRLRARLYLAQVFDGAGCEAIIGRAGEMVLGSCPLKGSDKRVLILSDPDLVNNHGLRLGENADIARALFDAFSDQGQIVIDYSERNWIVDRSRQPARERTWSDLMRFFEPPFLAMWLSAGLIFALLLWRASLRYGPVLQEEDSMGASKTLAIGAQARLLRLTGQDGALLSEYAEARIASVVRARFGPGHTRGERDVEFLLRHVGRRAPERAAHLRATLDRINLLPPNLPAREAIAHVDALETILEKITHDT